MITAQQITRIRDALHGIASCASNCECCRAHQEIAERALRETGLYHELCKDDPLTKALADWPDR